MRRALRVPGAMLAAALLAALIVPQDAAARPAVSPGGGTLRHDAKLDTDRRPPVVAHPRAAAGVSFCRRPSLTASQAIDCLWPAGDRRKAHRVAECESTASAPERIARARGLGRWARNGRYVGVFQMGPPERRDHGWYAAGAPAVVQVRAARSLFLDRGWSPWSCA